MSGGWSNDQLNQVFVYDPATGTLTLRVDSTGLYYYNVASGTYFQVTESSTFGGSNVAIRLYPGPSSVPGVTWAFPAEIAAGEEVLTPGVSTCGVLEIFSPQINNLTTTYANIAMASQTNNSATDNSQISFFASYLAGDQENEIGQGTTDEGGGGYTSANFTGTEIAADYCDENYGTWSTSRRYIGRFSGTVQSSSSGDRVGLKLYTSASKTSLAGATLLVDYGQITIAAANTPQPFSIEAAFNGLPGKFFVMGARRVSGAGTCFLTINQRFCYDTVHSY